MRRLAVLLLAGAVLVGCARDDGLPGAPRGLVELLRVAPDTAVSRGLFYSDLRAGGGFGTVVPLGDGALGFTIADVERVVESGEPPLTVLAGEFDTDAVDAALRRVGYEPRDRGDWRLYRRDGPIPGMAPAVAAVPAAAVRGRVVVLGDADEVGAAVDGAVAQPWLLTLARSAGPDAAAVVLAHPPDPRTEARRAAATVDGLLDQHGARVPLAPYQGYALAWQPDGEGVVALAYTAEAGGPEQASALALRVATGRLAGEPARGPTDWWEPGAPRWRERAGVVVLPVHWRSFDPDALRSDVSAERLLFLAPR